jgi:hypothetical protein
VGAVVQSLSVVCVSTKNNNVFSDSLNYENNNTDSDEPIELDFSSVKKLDFTHALINNGVGEYKLEVKKKVPEFNEVKKAWTLSHVYWRHDDPEPNGFQNLKATVELMIMSMRCAYKQNINIKHCQSVELLIPETEKDGDNVKARLISFVVEKLKNGKYNEDTSAYVTFCDLK